GRDAEGEEQGGGGAAHAGRLRLPQPPLNPRVAPPLSCSPHRPFHLLSASATRSSRGTSPRDSAKLASSRRLSSFSPLGSALTPSSLTPPRVTRFAPLGCVVI